MFKLISCFSTAFRFLQFYYASSTWNIYVQALKYVLLAVLISNVFLVIPLQTKPYFRMNALCTVFMRNIVWRR